MPATPQHQGGPIHVTGPTEQPSLPWGEGSHCMPTRGLGPVRTTADTACSLQGGAVCSRQPWGTDPVLLLTPGGLSLEMYGGVGPVPALGPRRRNEFLPSARPSRRGPSRSMASPSACRASKETFLGVHGREPAMIPHRDWTAIIARRRSACVDEPTGPDSWPCRNSRQNTRYARFVRLRIRPAFIDPG